MTRTKKTTGEAHFTDIGMGWLVRYQFEEHWLDFQAYEVVTRSIPDDVPGYRKKGELNDFTEVIEEADVDIDGYVKWDGCAQMNIGGMHFCGARNVREFTEVMRRLHSLALLIPRVDYGCADYPEGTRFNPAGLKESEGRDGG